MIQRKLIYYATPGLLAIIIFASNFLSTDIFKAGYQNFSVWFVLSVFAFACGWLINKTLGYNHGGKVVFSVIVASSFISVLLISFFSEYFGLSELIVENMILYILRNIALGSMALFGMAVCELLLLQKEGSNSKNKIEEIKRLLANTHSEARLIIEDARLKSEKMLYDAQRQIDDMINKKNEIEIRLKEFIAAERDLITKYESDEE
jgi:signal transduction histidine kinase